jgi:ABC-type sugar transport system ATPase subunit
MDRRPKNALWRAVRVPHAPPVPHPEPIPGGPAAALNAEHAAPATGGLALDEPVLRATGLVKRYGTTCALDGATLSLRPRSIHALLGENGAGKSTLVKVISGVVQPDAGELWVEGRRVRLAGPTAARAEGIVTVHQHLSLFPDLSLLENLSAFSLAGAGGIRASGARVTRPEAERMLALVGLRRDPRDRLGDLSLGERQLLEIARACAQRCRVLILDEPTAALSDAEAERLFGVIRRICAGGAAAVFIGHRLDEVESIATEVTVLRDGRTVISGRRLEEVGRGELVAAMVGARSAAPARAAGSDGRGTAGAGAERGHLVAEDLRATRRAAPASFALRGGEVLAVAGLVGSGAMELAAALAGAQPGATGALALGGSRFRPDDRLRAARLGIGYVPADRHRDALFPVLTAVQNASAASLDRHCHPALRRLFLRRAGERADASRRLSALALRPFDLDLPISGFSGGNQQKIVLARALAMPALSVLVLCEPTRGVDVAARAVIHDAIRDAASRGVAVVVASSDLDEVALLADRVVVVVDGEVVRILEDRPDRAAVVAAIGAAGGP